MKKLACLVFVLLLVFSTAACRANTGNAGDADGYENTGNNEISEEESTLTSDGSKDLETDNHTVDTHDVPCGYDSEDELLMAYINCLNNDLDFEDFFESFDAVGYSAYWVQEETVEDFDGAYDAFVNPEKGAAYLCENYADFIEEWVKPMTVEEYVDSVVQRDGILYNALKDGFLKVMENQREKFGPYELKILEENKRVSETGRMEYKIYVHDPEGYIQSVGISYFCRDGKFYWYLTNMTA